MGWLLIVRELHVLLAFVSGVYFAGRGVWRLGLRLPLDSPAARIAPHVLDTLLLVTGITVAVSLRYVPTAVPWFGTKLMLVVLYILLGIAAFRVASPRLAWPLFVAALATWLWILGAAMNRSPMGWLA